MKFVDPNFRASPRKGKAKREGVTLGVPLSPSVDTLGNFTTELVSCVLCEWFVTSMHPGSRTPPTHTRTDGRFGVCSVGRSVWELKNSFLIY